jgi:hypothetical protein
VPSSRLKTSFTTMGLSLMSLGRAWITSFYQEKLGWGIGCTPLPFAPSSHLSLRHSLPHHPNPPSGRSELGSRSHRSLGVRPTLDGAPEGVLPTCW